MLKANDMVNVWISQPNETILYAAKELCKYLNIMADSKEEIIVNRGCLSNEQMLKVGLFNDFKIDFKGLNDFEKDDAIYIDVKNSKGIIAGSNPRSVLFAVYRFLEENGCKWIKPGKDGEIIPKTEIRNLEANISEKAFSRYRGFNLCGAFSIEHVLEKIEFMPKLGLNIVYNELAYPLSLYNDWYEGKYYTLKQPQRRSFSEEEAYHLTIRNETKKRGLILQGGGHIWGGEIFGINDIASLSNDILTEKIGKEINYVAMVNGKRELNVRGIRFTEFCYGNDIVREKLIHTVADYAEKSPQIDILSFWFTDSLNAYCECELCKDTRPSDFYVMILNGIDEELTKRGIKTRIGTLMYLGLLWAPEKNKIKNPDRFVMQFCPIHRKYNETYNSNADEDSLGEFKYNECNPKLKLDAFMIALKKWKNAFIEDINAFDYHLTWYHYYDQGYYNVAKQISKDIKEMPGINVNGLVGCDIVVGYFPNTLPLYIKAKFLWNKEEDFDKLAIKYFDDVYGKDGQLCREYMRKLSELFSPNHFYNKFDGVKRIEDDKIALEKILCVPSLVEEFRVVIERNIDDTTLPNTQYWEYMFLHSEFVIFLSRALAAMLQGKQALADKYWIKTVEYLMINENRLKNVFDAKWFFMSFERWNMFFLYDKNTNDAQYQAALAAKKKVEEHLNDSDLNFPQENKKSNS